MPHDEYREMARESIKQFSRRPPDEQVLEKLLEQRALRARHVRRRRRVYERLKETLDEFDEEAGIAFNRLFYLVDGAQLLRP